MASPHGLSDSPVAPADGSPPSLLCTVASSMEASVPSAAAATYDHFQWQTQVSMDCPLAVDPRVVGASDDLVGFDAAETPAATVDQGESSQPSSPLSFSASPSSSFSLMDLGAVLGGSAMSPSTSAMDIVPGNVSHLRRGLDISAACAAATTDSIGSPVSSADASWDECAYSSPPALSCWASAWPVTRRSSRRRRRGKRAGGGNGSSVGSPPGSWCPSTEVSTSAAVSNVASGDAAVARVRAAAAAASAAGVAVLVGPSSVGLSSPLSPPPARTSWTASDDVTASHVSAGRDVQGIPWETLLFSRESYRSQRLAKQRATYASSRGVSSGEGGGAGASTNAVALPTPSPARTSSPLFAPRVSSAASPDAPRLASGTRPLRALRFVHTTRQVRCSVNHFQLRNLVWAPSAHDVYLQQENGVVHWDAVTRTRRCVVDLSGATPGLPRVQVSTMTAGAGLLLAGGFDGELVAAATDGAVLASGRLASSGSITTGLAVYDQDASHGPSIITCSNDAIVRTFDAASLASPGHLTSGTRSTLTNDTGICGTVSGSVTTHRLPWAANHVSRQPRGGRLLAVAGDHSSVLLLDATGGDTLGSRSGSSAPVVASLVGHKDDCFATTWAPNGVVVATGSQDGTARLWDIRRPTTVLGIASGLADGPVRSLRFSPCGRLLAVAEPCDYVRVVDVASVACCGGGGGGGGGGRPPAVQDVDVFGEVGGIAWTPEGGRLYVGVHDDLFGCLLEMEVTSSRRSAADAAGL
ncbi:hypothetical protein MMPV_006772 [Pyropia vietnamensis]